MINPRIEPTRALFRDYLERIETAQSKPDPFGGQARLSLANLAYLCRTGADQADRLPIDKSSRWLGFIQGCLVMRGLLDVDLEREKTRTLFHGAYDRLGIDRPGTYQADPEPFLKAWKNIPWRQPNSAADDSRAGIPPAVNDGITPSA